MLTIFLMGAHADAQFTTPNVLSNPGGEDGDLTGWTVGGNSNPSVGSSTTFGDHISPHSGKYDFVGGAGSQGTLTQKVSLLSMPGITTAAIDAGKVSATVSFWEQGLHQGSPSDDARISVIFYNSSSGVISYASTAVVDSHYGVWKNLTATFPVPPNTRSVAYVMDFLRNYGTDLDAFIDDNSLTFTAPNPPTVTTAAEAGSYGKPFSYQISATGTPTEFATENLPAGLSLNADKGLISGTPTVYGDFNIVLEAINVSGTGSATLPLTIVLPLPAVTSKLTATGTTGVPFTYRIAASDLASGFYASGLPVGLTQDGTTCVISGTPVAAGTTSVTLNASNVTGTSAAKTLTLKILPAPPMFTLAEDNVEAGSVTAAITAQVAANPLSSKVWLQYGRTDAYGLKTTTAALLPDQSGTSFDVTLVGLAPHTGYHYRIAGTNSSGTGKTTDQSFRTFPKSNLSYSGCADLLLTDTSSGQVSFVSELTGSSSIETTELVISSSLTWCGLADLTNSGTQQAILFNTNTREMQFWQLGIDPVTVIGVTNGPAIPNGFTPVAVNEMTASGKSDLIVVNTATRQIGFWTLSGTSIVAKVAGPTMSKGFELVAADDFTGDAKPDLLLWNPSTGATEIKVLNGTTLKSTLDGSSTLDTGTGVIWQLIGADDFTGGGTAEWLLYNPSTQETQVWTLNKAGKQTTVIDGPTLPENTAPLGVK